MAHTYESVSFDDDFVQIIDGQKTASPTTRPVLNPATRRPIAPAPVATKEQLDAAVAAAGRAFPEWAATPWVERSARLRELGALAVQFAEPLGVLLTKETGKAFIICKQELMGMAASFQATASQTLEDEVTETKDSIFTEKRTPIGVGAAIVPWNFPMSILSWKISPALLAGNTVIVKPSPMTPLATLKFVELAQQILPPGVLSVLSGDDDLGPWVTSHPGIAKVSFTGSTLTGQAVMRSAAAGMKRITLELGGNDAAIVLPDVDVEKVAPQLFWAMFRASGQVCVATKRTYVHADVYEPLRDAILAIARKIRIGDGLNEHTEIGPLQNEMQFERIKSLVADCKNAGLKVHEAGVLEGDENGYFLPIMLVDNPPESARIVREEQFGPIAPLIKWADEEEVIRLANGTHHGLGASVWGTDVARVQRIAGRLDAGMVWMNQTQSVHPLMGFGGHKLSGVGVEGGKHGLLAWTNVTTMVERSRS